MIETKDLRKMNFVLPMFLKECERCEHGDYQPIEICEENLEIKKEIRSLFTPYVKAAHFK